MSSTGRLRHVVIMRSGMFPRRTPASLDLVQLVVYTVGHVPSAPRLFKLETRVQQDGVN